jgi:hypothetical protein
MNKITNLLIHARNGYSFTRFEVEHLGDHNLLSIFSTLANKYGLTFNRTPEQAPNSFGIETRIACYLPPPLEHDRPQQLFSMLKKRGSA